MNRTEFELTVLGTSAATAGNGRHLSGQVLTVQGQVFLIDCGEGTLYKLLDNDIRQSRIEHIFISHLHHDHILGLTGLLAQWSMLGKTSTVSIYSPEPDKLREIVCTPLRLLEHTLPFQLHFLATNTEKSELIFENSKITVHSIPLQHRVAAAGFLFKEKKGYFRLKKEVLETLEIPQTAYLSIKEGESFTDASGQIIPNSELAFPPYKTRSFAYCSDTIYLDSVAELVKNVNLLYHEATFLHDKIETAQRTRHSTALQAATIAKKAQVERLIMGHFSVRYGNLSIFEQEAKTIFENSVIAEENTTYKVENTVDI
jgi:ribonuclease Z